jgi:hypothetical protein
MATVNLGSIKFKWKGTYSGATAYTVDDVVEYNGSSYICILASTGNLPTNATYFEQMSSAGTNGTDLTSTLTTQGDLVYRDGSGLVRLGAGTSGQVLQTGGAGANPSWGTVSSDFVKIASTEITSPTTSITFQQVFDSTYDRYIITGDGLYPDTTGSNLLVRGIYGVNTIESNAGVYKQTAAVTHLNSSNGSGVDFASDWSSYGEFYLTYYAGNSNGSGVNTGSIFTTSTSTKRS